MQYSKEMTYAGSNFGTLNLVGHLEFDQSVLVLIVKFSDDNWSRMIAIEAVEQVFQMPSKGYWTRLLIDGKECIRVEVTLASELRKPGHYTRYKARKLAQRMLEYGGIAIYNSDIEHAASEFPGYVPGEASLAAFMQGQIDRTGRWIK